MKKSKTRLSSKRKDRSPEIDPKRSEARSESSKNKESKRAKAEEKPPRKSRWETTSKVAEPPVESPVDARCPEGDEKRFPLRIKEMVGDKEKMVEHLFLAITGAALQELIPDYLKSRSIEELKKLCLTELNNLSDSHIVHIISGKDSASFSEEGDTDSKDQKAEMKEEEKGKDTTGENISQTHGDSEIRTSEENKPPVSAILDSEISLSAEDSDLLELEMRARAIRSLLKAKGQGSFIREDDDNDGQEDNE